MSVLTNDRRLEYAGNGVATVFAGPKTYDASWLSVTEVDDTDGTEVELSSVTDYTVSGIGLAASTVTLTTPTATGKTLVVMRTVPLLQSIRFANQGPFFAELHEQAFDLAVMRDQQLAGELSTALRLPLFSFVDTELPEAVAGGVPMINDAGDGFVWAAWGYNEDALASLALSSGSGRLGYLPSGTGAVPRTVEEKLRELPSASDFLVAADGVTDDAVPLLNGMNAAVAAGRVYELDGDKTYAISSLALPAGLNLRTNGATFVDAAGTASNSPLITVAANVWVFGDFKVETPAGRRRDRVISASAPGICFQDVDVSSVDQQANTSDNDDAAVRFVGADDIQFGRLRVSGFDQAVQIKGCGGVPHGAYFDISSYTRAVQIEDTAGLVMNSGGHIRTASPNATYTPGHVGMLLSATTDDATANITFPSLVVEDSGEHGVRVAGPGRISDVHFPGLHTKNTGGCGLKILGTDSGTPTSRNRNITAHGATFEDAGTGGLTSNMCGLLAMFCDGVYADNIIVRKNGKLQSAHTAVRIVACADVRITGDFGDATFDGVWLDGSLGDLDRVHVGGISRGNGRDGYRLTVGTSTARRVTTDLNCDGNTGKGMNIAVGAGTMTDSLFRAKLHSNTGGSAACDSTAATLDFSGLVGTITPLSGITAADGSTWRDTGGRVYQRTGSDWIGRGRVRLGASVVNNNAVANTMQDVTGLAFPVKVGSVYRFRFVIPYAAAATTTGSRWSITGPAAIYLNFRSEYSLTATTRTVNEGLGGAYDAPAASNTDSASLSRNIAIIEGVINPNADGTLQARFASEVAGSAITASAHAYVEYEEVID